MASLAGTATFVVCYGVAIALYPGGTWWNESAEGHSFWRNFLCDLMQSEALNHEPAPVGSLLARLGMAAMLLGMAAFYGQVSRLESSPETRAGRVARAAGILASLLGLAIPIVTSNLWRLGHLIVVVAAFVPSFVATVAASVICMRARGVSWLVRAAALVTLVTGGLDGFLYLFVYTSPHLGLVPESEEVRMLIALSLPALMRVATISLLIWVVAIARETLKRAPQPND
jgi:hypothetical protein